MTRSAIERLRELPEIFRGADLTVRFQWPSKTASQYLYLWRQRGLVAKLGGHSDIYANLVAERNPNWEKALRLAMPSAVVIGLEVLRRHGWTTQIPALPPVAVNNVQPVYQVEHFDISPRPPGWFTAARGGIRPAEGDGAPELAPAWALADLIKRYGWPNIGLDEDDIYWDQITDEDQADWARACIAFGLPSVPLAPREDECASECMR